MIRRGPSRTNPVKSANGAKKRRPGNRGRKPSAWQRSLTFKEIARRALLEVNKRRAMYARCGASAKSTGEPCKQLALENGRCHWHGGLTPKGGQWGKRQFRPKPTGQQTAGDWRRAEAKLQRQAAEDRDRIRRLHAMTDAEFYAYVRRMGRRLDDPYAPAMRNAIREEFARRGPDPARQALTATAEATPTDPEVAAIESRIAELRSELDTTELKGVFE